MRKKTAAVLATVTLTAVAAALCEAATASASSTTAYAYVQNLIDKTSSLSAPFCELTITQAADGTAPNQSPSSVGWSVIFLSSSGWQQLSGQGKQLFSDRRTSTYPSQPFDQNQADTLGLSLANDPSTGATTVTLTALSWGGAQQRLSNLRVEDGMLIGDGASIGNRPVTGLYVLSCGMQPIPG